MTGRRGSRVLSAEVRAAVKEALDREPVPFQLFGRGHERRVTLSPSLAAMLRGEDIPRIHISGFGANYYYPFRVMDRAREILNERLGAEVMRQYGASMYLVAEEFDPKKRV